MILNIWGERGWELWSKLMLILSNYHANFIIFYRFIYQSMRIFNANPTILFLQETNEIWRQYSTITQIFENVTVTWWSHRKPRLWPKPSLSRPKPTSTAQASLLRGPGREKPSLAGGFQAEPSRHITIINKSAWGTQTDRKLGSLMHADLSIQCSWRSLIHWYWLMCAIPSAPMFLHQLDQCS